MIQDPPIRDAATVIVLRDRQTEPRVLVGQRGSAAVFMPSKFVFPGGAVDAADRVMRLARPPAPLCLARLQAAADPGIAEPLMLAAIRELWEETGLALGEAAAPPPDPAAIPPDWRPFATRGARPSGEGLTFVFRAVTPPSRSRRFDARFFLADAERILGDPDDFSAASDELGHLHWAPLASVRQLDLPFITEVVLAEVQALLEAGGTPDSVPYYHHEGGRSYFDRL
jgi:8-oxo-dGTP pyrophosphatase MutT (NUDIX family)